MQMTMLLFSHGLVIDDFVRRCEESFLQLNISKTKDMIIYFSRHVHSHEETLLFPHWQNHDDLIQ